MKFGSPSSQKDLDHINLSLPPDHEDNIKVLGGKKKDPKVYSGCAKWGRKEWVGLIYPENTTENDFLDQYVKHFNSIELNGTFYNARRKNIESWAVHAPDGFKFSPKFSRNISHVNRLKEDAIRFTDYFVETVRGFGNNLGASFLQLPENFTAKYIERLHDYLKNIPSDFLLFVEFRHPSWFSEPSIYEETFDVLKETGTGAVITDVASRRDVLHQRLTLPKVFIRFNGYNLHQSDYKRLDDWILRIKQWMDQGLEELYFYLHQQDEAYTPETCDYFIKNINEVCHLKLHRPAFMATTRA